MARGKRNHRISPAHGVEAPYKLGICTPSFRCSNFLHAMAIPEAARAAERGKTALSGDARARENEKTIR
jgi:hypothetical protein